MRKSHRRDRWSRKWRDTRRRSPFCRQRRNIAMLLMIFISSIIWSKSIFLLRLTPPSLHWRRHQQRCSAYRPSFTIFPFPQRVRRRAIYSVDSINKTHKYLATMHRGNEHICITLASGNGELNYYNFIKHIKLISNCCVMIDIGLSSFDLRILRRLHLEHNVPFAD